MPGRNHFSCLHDDLVIGILVLLPLKEAARARLVCRRWNALTGHHHFARTSFSLSLSRHAGRPVAGFFLNDGISYCYFPLDSDAETENPSRARLTPDLSFIADTLKIPLRIHVTSSCNGLVTLVCWLPHYGETYICNPLTKKLIPIGIPIGVTHNLNIAFDPTTSWHYKVVALGHMCSIYVYSSETRSWRMAVHWDHTTDLYKGLRSFHGVFWNGSIIWNAGHSLFRFFIQGEYLTNLPMPQKGKDWFCAYIGESGGHLQLIGYTKKEKLSACFDILEMQEDLSKWLVLYRVDLSRVKELYPDIEQPTWDTQYHQHKIVGYLALSPIYVIRGIGKNGRHGVLIFSIPGKIMSYNMEDQKISIVREMASPREAPTTYKFEQCWCNLYAYCPSLFAL